ncbi:MAG TPA: ATP synthase F1 subunit delta [Tepidisphaeraceae bacterium]|jgi:F-type H+-transporting ATPase subunit delta
MREPTHYSAASQTYARALLELAEERKLSLQATGQELSDVRAIVQKDQAVRLYFADPAVGTEERSRVIERAFKGKVSPLVFDFLRLLNQKGRMNLLGEITDAYGELLDEKLGKVEVDLIVAQKLTPDQVESAHKQLSHALMRDAVVHTYVDERIIGGAIVRVGDKLMDASVKTQLDLMKQKLLAARPK